MNLLFYVITNSVSQKLEPKPPAGVEFLVKGTFSRKYVSDYRFKNLGLN
jgi:hypothetical protein